MLTSRREGLMKFWKINCMEDRFPGMWQRWFIHQCVGVGWFSGWGHHLEGPTDDYGWSRTRNALDAICPGDMIVVALHGHRVGRLGEVTGKAISDSDWAPLVPPSKEEPDGEMGRRIFMLWDLTTGPQDRDLVVQLPEDCRLSSGELRPTLCEIRSRTVDEIRRAMNDAANWTGLLTHFNYEAALQSYIAAYPNQLEDGLLAHPDIKVREKVFDDRSRLDILLIDREERPVVVECKRGAPSPPDVHQLRHYMERLQRETGREPRGILVHGGALKLSNAVRIEANKEPPVEIVRYVLKVDFDSSR